jgi:tetratricopeptide (TPR) repeat protein
LLPACSYAHINLGLAYLAAGRYEDSLGMLSSELDAEGPVTRWDPVEARFRADAHQARAFARVMTTQQQNEPDLREAGFRQAEQDLLAAIRIHDRLGTGADRPLFDILWARIEIGRGEYAEALSRLELVARISNGPDVRLLMSAVYRCLGDPQKSLERFQTYMNGLDLKVDDPHWQRYKAYYQGIMNRCTNAND